MLTLTKKAEYALIAACHLARGRERVISARDIAAHHRVSLPLLMNVLKSMAVHGLVRSVRGAHGGYSLAAPANALSLADLVEAVEGPAKLVRCASPQTEGEAGCELVCSCVVRQPLLRVHERLKAFLNSVTVAELAADLRYGEIGPLLSIGKAMAQ